MTHTPAPASTSSWPAREPKTYLLFGLVLLALAVRDIIGLMEVLRSTAPDRPDFFGLWSFARFAAERPPTGIYDPVQLQAFQRLLAPDFKAFYPFPYPPHILLALTPLGWMGYSTARIGFLAASLVTLVPLTIAFAQARGLLAAAVAATVLVAPVTPYTLLVGQNGMVFGALLLAGLLALERRPVLAGCLFGLLTCKPQFGLLLPFALLGLGAWRAIAATCASTLALVLASCAIHGWAMWPAWLASLGEFSTQLSTQQENFLPLMASPAAGLLRMGAPAGLAMAIQAAISLALAGAIWLLFRRTPYRAAAAALLPAVGLATPYAFIYDQPVVLACLAWLFVDRWQRDAAFGLGELAVMLAALLAPAFLLHPWLNLPVVAASQVALFLVAARHAWAVSGDISPPTGAKSPAPAG
jgi:hypothetical protein